MGMGTGNQYFTTDLTKCSTMNNSLQHREIRYTMSVLKLLCKNRTEVVIPFYNYIGYTI